MDIALVIHLTMFGCPLCFPKSECQNTLQVLKTMFLEPEKN